MKRKQSILNSIVIVGVILSILVTLGGTIFLNLNVHKYVITVTDKERIVEYNNSTSSKYLVFGDNIKGESMVFENTDTLFHLKYNSSNIQGQLKIGRTYEVTVVGVRIPFLSMYENILDVTEIDQTN